MSVALNEGRKLVYLVEGMALGTITEVNWLYTVHLNVVETQYTVYIHSVYLEGLNPLDQLKVGVSFLAEYQVGNDEVVGLVEPLVEDGQLQPQPQPV